METWAGVFPQAASKKEGLTLRWVAACRGLGHGCRQQREADSQSAKRRHFGSDGKGKRMYPRTLLMKKTEIEKGKKEQRVVLSSR